MSRNDRTVYSTSGGWANKRNNSSRPASIHSTQAAAEAAAKKMVHAAGGGEVTVQGKDGRFKRKDTIAPGNDPNPPKDKRN